MKTIEVVAAVIYDGARVFATQRGYGEFKGMWEFPGGKIEPGESPENALRRELREELDTEVEIEGLLVTVTHDYPAFHLVLRCYLCRLAGGIPRLLEHEDAVWADGATIGSLRWLPADYAVVDCIRQRLRLS